MNQASKADLEKIQARASGINQSGDLKIIGCWLHRANIAHHLAVLYYAC